MPTTRRSLGLTITLAALLTMTSVAPAVAGVRRASCAPVTTCAAAASAAHATNRTAVAPRVTAAAKAPTPSYVKPYGASASGLSWHSGIWTGGYMSGQRVQQAAAWRGNAMDFATMYPAYETWASIRDSEWHIATYAGFPGRLSYGLPLLPKDRPGQWQDVLSGAQDETFRGIARALVRNGRGDAAVRVGLEANGDWFAWGTTRDTAPQYKAAFRRVVQLMRAEAPRLTFWFDLNAGTPLAGGASRLDALTLLYPGDDVVTGISMDHYDHWQLRALTETEWSRALRPMTGPGLADAVDFARKRRKGFAVPEWGVHGVHGNGDNPFFIRKMHEFFTANKDVLVYEAYFNEGDDYIRSALWELDQNPQSAATYRSLFTRPAR